MVRRHLSFLYHYEVHKFQEHNSQLFWLARINTHCAIHRLTIHRFTHIYSACSDLSTHHVLLYGCVCIPEHIWQMFSQISFDNVVYSTKGLFAHATWRYVLTHLPLDKMATISQRCIFLNEKRYILIEISLKFVLNGPFDNISELVWIMAWHLIGNKPLSEPMLTWFTDAYMRP